MSADGSRDWAGLANTTPTLGEGAIVTVAGDQGPAGEAHFYAANRFEDNDHGRWVRLLPLFPDWTVSGLCGSDLPTEVWALSLTLTVHMGAVNPWPIGEVS